MLEYIGHLLPIVSMIRENSRLYSFDSKFWRGGALKILKTWREGHKKFTNNLNRGPVKI
jgi:hypothetical protein